MHRKNGPDKAFYFKQFHIQHDRCAMKVGTDGVLLGAWTDVANKKKILDIGTGTGLIAIMLAQRTVTKAKIEAVEINKEAFEQACDNVLSSPWPNKINVIHSAIQHFESKEGYDLIVCNPPYFVNSLKPTDKGRTQSRHASDLTFEELVNSAKRLLAPAGALNIVLPPTEASSFIILAAKSGLYLTRKCHIRFKPSKPIERYLCEFRSDKPSADGAMELSMQTESGAWSMPYLEIVSPFYPWANQNSGQLSF